MQVIESREKVLNFVILNETYIHTKLPKPMNYCDPYFLTHKKLLWSITIYGHL